MISIYKKALVQNQVTEKKMRVQRNLQDPHLY